MDELDRRNFLALSALATSSMLGGCMTVNAPEQVGPNVATDLEYVVPRPDYVPLPEQAPVSEGLLQVSGAQIYYWDTGGEGEAVVLLHPATGNADIWPYQQPALADAGYRVISYSRRGHSRTLVSDTDNLGTMAGDLAALLDHLGVSEAHLVSSALGGAVAVDFAASHPERVRTITLASTLNGIDEPDFRQTTSALLPDGWGNLPASFKELAPSYRAAHPQGAQIWADLVARNGPRLRQPKHNQISYDVIAELSAPILTLTGSADLYFPPSRLHALLPILQPQEAYLFGDTGHAAHWEQPETFNQILIAFLDKY